jgi:hypothetical protein
MRRGSDKWLLSLAFALTVVGRPPAARADGGSGFVFEWQAPEGCPPSSVVEGKIAELLGGPALERARDDLRVQATVERGALWFVTLETTSRTASGHRTFEAATCQALANATALIVALLIDPDAVAARTGKSQEPEVRPPPPPAPTEPTPVVGRPGGARATYGLVGVAAAGNLGVLPSADLGVSASVGIVRTRWRIEARAAYSPRRVQSDVLTSPAGAYGRFSFVVGTLAGCLTFSRSVFEFGPCADAEFGAVPGEGIGATHTTSHTSPWVGVGAGGLLALKATPWLYFPVHADAVIPLWRPRFVFQNVQAPIFRSWSVGGRLTAGVELRF